MPKEVIKYKKIRNLYSNNERKALNAVLRENNEKEKSLRACHTKTVFIWEKINWG